MKLGKIYICVSVSSMRISKDVDSVKVSLEFLSEDEFNSVDIVGIRDWEDIGVIFSADRLWIESSDSNQLEYGKYLLGVSVNDEGYTEFCFDQFSGNGI